MKEIRICTMWLLATLGALASLTAGTARAADLTGVPAYMAPAKAPGDYWSGYYFGGNVGVMWAQNSVEDANINSFLAAVGLGVPSPYGLLFGGQFGHNWQVSQHVVVGLEADFDWADATDTTNSVLGCGDCEKLGLSLSQRIDWQGSVRGRLGWATPIANWPSLLYITGGLAWMHDTATFSIEEGRSAFSATADQNHFGGVIGAGVETILPFDNGQWRAKLEYLWFDYPDQTYTFDTGGGPAIAANNKPSNSVLRLGVNYRF